MPKTRLPKPFLYTALCCASLTLTACPGGTILERDIYLDADKKAGPSITTGARQRLITNTTMGVASVPGRVHAKRIICVEPSPDVAVAMANSFGLGLSVFAKGSGSLTGAQVEGVAQIAERTVAIQAILKQGHQACLDYANGAITGTTYSLRTSRLDDLLVTLVLSENASGAFGRSGAALGTQASADAKATLTDLTNAEDEVDKLQTELSAAEETVQTQQAAVDEAQAAFDNAPADNNQTEQQTLETEQTKLNADKATRNSILLRLKASTDTLSKVSNKVSNATGIGGIAASPSAEVAAVIGDMQARFLEKDIDQSVISACLTELGHRKVETQEYKDFLAMVIQRMEKATQKNTAFSEVTLEDYYLGSQLLEMNLLTEYCRDNLPTFVATSIENRHELKLVKLELERAKVALLTKQAETATATLKAIHPSATLNTLKKDLEVLVKTQDQLKGQAIPAAKAPLFPADARKRYTDAKNKKLAELVEVKAEAERVAKDSANDVNDLEARYLALVAHIDKGGAALERKAWQADFDKQQAEAEQKHVELSKLARKVRSATESAQSLIKSIKAIKTE